MIYDRRLLKQPIMRINKMTKIDFLNKKGWWQSKTVWVQIISLVLGISMLLTEQYQAGVTLTIGGVINTILRFLTKDEVTLK